MGRKKKSDEINDSGVEYKHLPVKMSIETHSMLRKFCLKKSLKSDKSESMNSVIVLAIEEYVKRHAKDVE